MSMPPQLTHEPFCAARPKAAPPPRLRSADQHGRIRTQRPAHGFRPIPAQAYFYMSHHRVSRRQRAQMPMAAGLVHCRFFQRQRIRHDVRHHHVELGSQLLRQLGSPPYSCQRGTRIGKYHVDLQGRRIGGGHRPTTTGRDSLSALVDHDDEHHPLTDNITGAR